MRLPGSTPLPRTKEIGLLAYVDFGGCVPTDFGWGGSVLGGEFVVWLLEWGDSGNFATAHVLLHFIVPIRHRNAPEFELGSTIDPVTEALLRLNAHPLLKAGMSLEQARELIVLDDELLDARGTRGN